MRSGEEFRFLNVSCQFPGGIDWGCANVSKLWRYNLHYFDYVLDPCRPADWVEAVIADWVRKNPPGKSDGWEPYPVSLRVVNWIKFALTRSPGGVVGEGQWLDSLYQQLAWLERNVEHEILANHLLKNAKALVLGGAFFAGSSADRWLETGLRLFLREVEEQVLQDGGHYERSLMYHAIVVEDLLDVLNLAVASPGLVSEREAAMLEAKSRAGLEFLEELCCPDGEIPLFNDAAFGISATASALSEYGARVIGHGSLAHSAAPRLIDKPATGYFGYRAGDEMLLIDAGPIGPTYQPGHGHCDMLSFELVLDSQRVIVDSGVFSYENDELRHRLRGTAAHNTVRIDSEDQSDIWGAFRVGRRAKPFGIALDAQLPERFVLRAAHDGYRHLTGHPIHERTFTCDIGRRWAIADLVLGQGRHHVESFIHIHPDIRVRYEAEAFVLFGDGDTPICRIRVDGADVELVSSIYCPEFGMRQESCAIRMSLNARLPAALGYTIERA